MTENEKERRRQLSFIVERLSLITNKPSNKLYGLAGKWRNLYSFDFILEQLGKIPEGCSIAYCIGTFRREYGKTNEIPSMNRLVENFVDG